MYKVKLFPSKCSISPCWIDEHKEGEIYHISDSHFNHHKPRCNGCMKPLEHYREVTVEKKKCKHCGSIIIKRKKIKIKD